MDWMHNIWTGNDLLDVDKNTRILRIGSHTKSYQYCAEYWGDYSQKFPIRGPWRSTLDAAKKDIPTLKE